jgi:hypothetical protein
VGQETQKADVLRTDPLMIGSKRHASTKRGTQSTRDGGLEPADEVNVGPAGG